MEFVCNPNLPESDAALIVVSGTYEKIITSLKSCGIKVITTEPCELLSAQVSCHTDMLIHHLGENQIIVVDKETHLSSELRKHGFHTIQSNKCISRKYPHDVIVNAARVGNYLIANISALDPVIQHYCKEKDIVMIPVKQGYAKCSTVVVNANSIITEDPSIASAAAFYGLEVLKISSGFVKLDGYSYGFLGGACGMIGKINWLLLVHCKIILIVNASKIFVKKNR